MMFAILDCTRTMTSLLCDLARFIWLLMRPRGALAAENLFLRKQLAMHQERKLKPRRPDAALRVALVLLSRLFDWKHALIVTTRPTAEWTRQQLREAIPADHGYRFLIHDRDGIFSPRFDRSVVNMGLRVLRTPPRSPQANSLCERVIGTLRRECLDFMIPLTQSHLRLVLKRWAAHYNQGRPHSSLGPGIPDPPTALPVAPHKHRHIIPGNLNVVVNPILGGLHHEYGLVPKLA